MIGLQGIVETKGIPVDITVTYNESEKRNSTYE